MGASRPFFLRKANQMADVYEQERRKYEGRESVLEQVVVEVLPGVKNL